MSEGIKRRDFLKVVGVGGAGAALSGCSDSGVERYLPYVVPPEDITPGVATWYTSVCTECAANCGIWVKTREGRAIKVEGNPNHPVSNGHTCARGQAAVQGLYNPDRLAGPMVREGDSFRQIGWDEAEQMFADRMGAASSPLLVHGSAGPTMADLLGRFAEAAGAERVEYEALSEAPLREATRIGFGRDTLPTYDLENARLVLSFGADFLETWLSPTEYARQFARMSAVDGHGSKGKMIFLGPRLSLTGQNADEWFPIVPGSEGRVALAMANVLVADGADAGPYAPLVAAHDPQTVAGDAGISAEEIETLARRFVEEGPSVALGPGVAAQSRTATGANLAVLILNAVAGNMGRTVNLQNADLAAPSAPYGGLQAQIERMGSGEVDAALILGTNPAYSLPAGSGFADAFGSVGFKVVIAESMDETAAMADLVLPDRNGLESWGDSNPRPGVYALQQPAMQPVPMFDSKQAGDILLSVAQRMGSPLGPATLYDHLRARWQAVHADADTGLGFEEWWREALKAGVVQIPMAFAAVVPTLQEPDRALSTEMPELDGDGEFALVVYPSSRFGDGRQANRPWMQELPDPVSKITWHSWVEVNPHTAERLGLRDGDVVAVTSPHGSVEVPVWSYPGIREDVVALQMGTGHTEYGRFASGNGVNAVSLLPAVAEQPSGALVHLATRVDLAPTGERYRLSTIEGASTQHDRNIAPAVTLASIGHDADEYEGGGEGYEGGHGQLKEIQEGGGFIPVPIEGEPTDYPLAGAQYGDYANPETLPRWGMAIDLDKCTGCSACVTACQAENNIPWVGEDQIRMGRDMHWIRLERYYETVDATHSGPVDVRHLPMLCQHCGNAPCEPVCPVYAAYHTPEGINGQVYNRCVGTRYCANNCPYKVRVFNWYTYTDVPEPMNWQYNPDVTVRENGVMEKCSFCTQRIREAQNLATLENREVQDGEIMPACQSSCPAEAIVFGDLRDPTSRVSQVSQNERTYRVLDDLINTQPGVNYLKKVTFHEVTDGGH